jgi:hypothetical protein
MNGHQQRSNDLELSLCDMVDHGKIGGVQVVSMQYRWINRLVVQLQEKQYAVMVSALRYTQYPKFITPKVIMDYC